MADDLATRSKQLAAELLAALDQDADADADANANADADAPGAALAETLVAAWDHAVTGAEVAFTIHGVSDAGARPLGTTEVGKPRRAAIIAAMRRRQIPVGATYGASERVWTIADGEVGVWTRSARVARGTLDRLELAGGAVARAEIAAVVASVSDDYVERAVAVERADGTRVVVADERDEIAALDPTYGRDDFVMSDARWASCLARDLAFALGVPLRDELFATELDVAVARALGELAAAIDRLPPTGAFEPVERAFAYHGQDAVVRCAPSPADPERARFVEVRVASSSGQSTSSQWIASGATAELAAAVRWPECAAQVVRTARELVEAQQRHRMG